MNDKLTTQNLIDNLAARHGISRRNAESFVKEFFSVIKDSLERERYVKIKGLGTFKLIDVESRESIDVNTGERIEIKGHTKVTFTPEAALKEAINKPFSQFETTVLNDNFEVNVSPAEEETIESDDMPEVPVEDSVGTLPTKTPADESENPMDETEESEKSQESDQSLLRDDSEISQRESSSSDKPTGLIDEPTDNQNESKSVVNKVEVYPKKDQSSLSGPMKWFWLFFLLILLLCGGVLTHTYFPDLFGRKSEQATKAYYDLDLTITDTVAKVDSTKPQVDSVLRDTLPAKMEAQVEVYEKNKQYDIVGTKATYTIQKNESLSDVSIKFFGIKELWPYIVKHNSDVIKNPDNVPFGTAIKIPKLTVKK